MTQRPWGRVQWLLNTRVFVRADGLGNELLMAKVASRSHIITCCFSSPARKNFPFVSEVVGIL